jgi:hypothetical protein
MNAKVNDLDRIITRMKATLSSTESNLTKIDKEIAVDTDEIKKLEDANNKLKGEILKNESAGTNVLAEMGAVD